MNNPNIAIQESVVRNVYKTAERLASCVLEGGHRLTVRIQFPVNDLSFQLLSFHLDTFESIDILVESWNYTYVTQKSAVVGLRGQPAVDAQVVEFVLVIKPTEKFIHNIRTSEISDIQASSSR